MYTTFEIPKKSGGKRVINAPNNDLKAIQKKLASAIYNFYYEDLGNKEREHSISHGFEKRKGIITNAEVHRNKRFVYNIDIDSFFDSFHFGRVKGFFEKNKDFLLPEQVAVTIAQLACYNGRLPQGAPTSPVITNIICNIMDMRLLSIAKKYRLDYTRYADDLTFSTNDKRFLRSEEAFEEELRNVIEHSGFKINDNKTRLIYRDSRQEVTGLIVNNKVNVQREYIKCTRAMADSLYRTGSFEIMGKEGTINHLEGRFSFINQLDKYNNIKSRGKKNSCKYSELNSREKQYQQFLFYKYFFSNEKPLIITEGKTDIVYLKCALKQHYDKYPKLIRKSEDGLFIFNVSFLNKTKRLRYFFNIQEDGADSMQNVFVAFVGMNGMPKYLNVFKEKCKRFPENPVILTFDNETVSERPLKKFVNKFAHLNDEKVEEFRKNYHLNLVDNLYLLTNPLIEGKEECEIEDLFDANTLAHKIDGREFSREKKINLKTHYAKAEFSQYIASSYKGINFEKFLPMLDAINSIIIDYEDRKREGEKK